MNQLRVVDLERDLETSYLQYAVEVIINRAIPRLEDGLKPVQRRIIYAMRDMGLTHEKSYKKCARIVGEVLGKYHPHGDTAVYDALVRMGQDFSLLHPLIDGQGNFGSIDGDGSAAMRYTEARLSAIAALLTSDLECDTVDWTDNFDGSLQEPVILPAALPNLLLNGSSGVAVGMATNIPPHSLGELCDALIHLTQNWEARDSLTTDAFLRFIPGPDFPTGGLAYRYRIDSTEGTEETKDSIRMAYETGKGGIVTQARVSIEQTKGGKADIVVTELPYAVQKSTVMEKIAAEVRSGRITGVTDLRDESDYSGMRMVVEVARGSDPRQVLESLLTYTQLRQTFGVNNLALINEEGSVIPKRMSLKEMLTRFISHRLTIIERRSRHELTEREARLHIVEGLLKALDVIDQVVGTIRQSKTTDIARQGLMKQFGFSEAQARAILEMQLRRLAGLEKQKLVDEKKELLNRIKYLQKLLASEKERLTVIVAETTDIKAQFATPRHTVIIDREDQAAGLSTAKTEAELTIPQQPQVIALTTQGIIRVDADIFAYKLKPGLSPKPVVAHLYQSTAQPAASIVLVSNRGRTWQAPLGRVPRAGTWSEVGLPKGKYVVASDVMAPDNYLVVGTRAGNIKRTRIRDLSASEASWATCVGLNDKGDQVLFAAIGGNDLEAMFFTAKGKAIRFTTGEIKPQATGSAAGVSGIKVGPDDALVGGTAITETKGAQVIIVSESGFIKRVALNEFPLQGRGGQGVVSLEVVKRTGRVVAAAVAPGNSQYCDVLSARGRVHRLPIGDLPAADRRKRGEKLIDFGADDTIVNVVVM
jgi:DNA gyrase subunit A